ncbi:MAG: hypothetical protein IPJ65_39085 [Archangiaceae bacterium]|nr:hypothetical protein [Archangiaceae bacterium]
MWTWAESWWRSQASPKLVKMGYLEQAAADAFHAEHDAMTRERDFVALPRSTSSWRGSGMQFADLLTRRGKGRPRGGA